MPVEGAKSGENFGVSISHIPLYRCESQITQNCYAFWKRTIPGYYVEEFAEMLKNKFELF